MSGYAELRSGFVRTRKARECSWCAMPILAGSRAWSRGYVWEGELRSDHMHPECSEAMDETHHRTLEEGWAPGDFERGRPGDEL